MQFNKVLIIGNLTRDPELRYNPSGKAVANLSIAVKGSKKDDVSFFDVVAWEKTAELCSSYLAKGSGVLIEGRLDQRRWEQDGQKRSKVEIIANNVQFLPKKGETAENTEEDIIDEGDIPF